MRHLEDGALSSFDSLPVKLPLFCLSFSHPSCGVAMETFFFYCRQGGKYRVGSCEVSSLVTHSNRRSHAVDRRNGAGPSKDRSFSPPELFSSPTSRVEFGLFAS